ncbi:MAG: hypothetical protein ACTSRA_11670, partial [Promethearchaeota archaeon]
MIDVDSSAKKNGYRPKRGKPINQQSIASYYRWIKVNNNRRVALDRRYAKPRDILGNSYIFKLIFTVKK